MINVFMNTFPTENSHMKNDQRAPLYPSKTLNHAVKKNLVEDLPETHIVSYKPTKANINLPSSPPINHRLRYGPQSKQANNKLTP